MPDSYLPAPRLDSDDARHQHDQAIRDYKRSRTAVKAENALKQESTGSSGTASSDTEPEGSEEKQGGEKDDAEQSQVSGFLVDYAKSGRSLALRFAQFWRFIT